MVQGSSSLSLPVVSAAVLILLPKKPEAVPILIAAPLFLLLVPDLIFPIGDSFYHPCVRSLIVSSEYLQIGSQHCSKYFWQQVFWLNSKIVVSSHNFLKWHIK